MAQMDHGQSRPQNRRNQGSEMIVSGSVWKAVWYLAWPTAINTFIIGAYNIVNRFFLGRLEDSTVSLAAAGIGGTALMIQFAVTIGLSAGSSALVSRFLGAGEYDQADEAAGQSLTLSAVVAVVSSLPFIFLARPLVALIGAQGPVIDLAADYTIIIALSSIPLFIYMVATTTLRSSGDPITPLYAGFTLIVFNVFLDWLLIFGIGPFPRLEIRGAAIATGLARIVGTGVALAYLKRSTVGGCFSHLRTRMDWFRRILHIGWPASIQNVLWTTASAAFLRVLAELPGGEATPAQAALTVGLTIESLSFMPGVAYSVAATPLVGQNLGAGQPGRAEHSAWVATGQAVAVMSFVAVLFLTMPYQFARAFTDARAVVPLIASYLVINAVSHPFLAINMVLRGALQGAGETRIPAWITFLTSWVIRIPFAWLLAINLGYGAVGAWVAMSGSTVLSGILVALYFKFGPWREVQV